MLYSAGDVFECGDVEQVRAWVATGAVGLMGAALPERVGTQAQGEMAATLEPTSVVSEAELPERIEPLESELGASGSEPAQEKRHAAGRGSGRIADRCRRGERRNQKYPAARQVTI